MEKYSERNIINQKLNSNSRIIHGYKNLKNNPNKIIKPQINLIPKIVKKEDKTKNIDINNQSLTDWNKKKVNKKIIRNLPPVPNLYLKKKVPQANNNNLINLVKKKNLSCTQEGIDKYTKKVVYDSKNNLSKKKIISNDISNCPDIDLELEKDFANDDEETINVHIPHMTDKKKFNYFFELQKTEIKNNNMKKINIDIKNNKIRLPLFSRVENDKKYENKSGNKIYKYKNIRAKTEKKKDENKENHNFNQNRNYKINLNVKNNFINNDNSYLAFKQYRKNKQISNIKKDSYLKNNFFNPIKKRNNLENNNINKKFENEITSKTIDYNLIDSPSKEEKTHISKKINISFIDANFKENNKYSNENKALNSKNISEKEKIDSPENITDREEDKCSLPIHKINHFFIEKRKKGHKKFERNSKYNNNNNNRNYCFLSPNQNLYFDLDSTDENCYAHHANISANYTNTSNKDNISSYKNNMNRLKNLTSERKAPLSLFLSPAKKNNLYPEAKNIKNKIINNINIQKNNLSFDNNKNPNKITLNDLLEINKIKKNIVKYLDIKSLIKLSSLNKNYYPKFRYYFFEYIKNNSISPNINNNERQNFIMKIMHSIFKYSTIKYKTKKDLKAFYNNYKVKSKYDIDIKKDLTRTFPHDKSFSKDSINTKKLYNILTSYSNYNKDIGYAQGLNFIGAISISIFKSEEYSFLFLDSLINKFNLDNYIGIDNKNLMPKLTNYSNVLNKYVPDIISYLERQQIDHGFFSTNWILTLFSNSMEKKCLITSWAFMIIFGWKFFYSLVIQILIYYKKDIFNTKVNELCFKMKNILSTDKFLLNYNNIIKETFSFMNRNVIL